MSEYGKMNSDSGKGNKTAEKATEKTGRRWLHYVVWGVAIFVAVFLIAGTMAAIFWC